MFRHVAWLCVLLVAVAVGVTRVRASCLPEDDPCCFQQQFTLTLSDYYYDYDDAAPVVYTSPAWMRACLRSVMMEGPKARATVTILRNILLETYSFSDLVRNSSNTDSSVEGYYAGSFRVHPIAVSAVSMLQDVLDDASTASDELADGDRVSSYAFHYGLAEVFRQLYDGHTQYSTPFVDWGLYRVVTLRPELNSDGDQVYVLKAMPGWGEGGFGIDFFTPERYELVHGVQLEDIPGREGKTVVTVNGVAVEEYVQARADSLGEIKSASGRVNNLLNFDYQPGMEVLNGRPPPENDFEVFEFSDGTSATWYLTVAYFGGGTGRQDLEAVYGASDSYDTFRELFNGVVQIYQDTWDTLCSGCNPYDEYEEGTRRSGGDDVGARSSPNSSSDKDTLATRMERWSAMLRERVAPELQRLTENNAFNAPAGTLPISGKLKSSGSTTTVNGRRKMLQQVDEGITFCTGPNDCDYDEYADYDYADFTDVDAVELASGVTQVQLYWAGETKANGLPFLGVYHVQAENGGDDEDAVVLKLNSFAPEYGAWAPMKGPFAGEVVPFYSALSNALLRADEYGREKDIDNLVLDVSANGGGWTSAIFYLLRLIMSEWTDWDDICDATFLKVSDLGNFFSQAGEEALLAVLDASPAEEVATVGLQILDIMDAIESINGLLSNVTDVALNSTAFADTVELREAMLSESLDAEAKRDRLREFLATEVEQLAHGSISLLAADGKYDLATKAAFESIEWYRQDRTTALRGGATVEYTQQYITECPNALAVFAYLHSDGADSVLHRFQKVIVLTDGTCGSACSTFATRLMLSGGVKSVSFGGRLDHPLGMDSSAYGGGNVYNWKTYARESVLAYFINLMLGHTPKPIDDMDITDVPVPLPSGASARFTVDNTLEPYLGPNSLPREFYSIPADVHLPMWAPGAGNFPTVAEGSSEVVHANMLPIWKATLKEFGDAPPLSSWRRKDWNFETGCAADCDAVAPPEANSPSDDSTPTPNPDSAATALPFPLIHVIACLVAYLFAGVRFC